MNQRHDSDYILEAILILIESYFVDPEDTLEEIELLIAHHWDLLEEGYQVERAEEILETLAEELNSEEGIWKSRFAGKQPPESSSAGQEQLALFDGPNEWSGGDRAGFEREQAAWLAIAEGLGGLGHELNSAEETRDWVVRNLL